MSTFAGGTASGWPFEAIALDLETKLEELARSLPDTKEGGETRRMLRTAAFYISQHRNCGRGHR